MGQNGERFVAGLFTTGISLRRPEEETWIALTRGHQLWIESKCLDARMDGWWKKAGSLVVCFS